jgi:iron complex transport system substrate-binding protein
MKDHFPKRIVCLTEESVETLYLLGKEDLIVGLSAYVERPIEAKKKTRVCVFTHAQVEKIVELKPDLVLGFSDIQKNIARELIGLGLNVFISNQRSIPEILNYIGLLGSMVGAGEKAQVLRANLEQKIASVPKLSFAPKVYFEEWDEPLITAIRWVSDCLEICGAKNIFSNQAMGSLAKDRLVSHQEVIAQNPDIIFGCWCGKKVDLDGIKNRPGYEVIKAVKENQVFELDPAIFLQPGPAPILAGLDVLTKYFWALRG